MMRTTRFWSSATVLLCALLLQNCQLNSVGATEEEVRDGERREQRCANRDTLSALLTMAGSEPDRATESLDVLLVAAQDNGFRQQALEALGKVAKASPDMFSQCLPSLRAAAKEGDREVRLLALKTLGEVEWKHYFGKVDPAPDLPSDMAAVLDSECSIWPGRKVKDTHLLVLIPATVDEAPFTLNLLEELIQRPKRGGHATKYEYYGDDTKAQFGNNSPDRSYWLLMTRAVLPESCGESYGHQKELIADHARRTSLPYELPEALEAATAILVHHVRTGKRLLGNSSRIYTRCQELVGGEYPIVVGGFESSGLNIFSSHAGSHSHSVAVCRKFF